MVRFRQPSWSFDERWVLRDPADHGDGIAALDKPSGLRSEPTHAGDDDNLLTLAAPRFGPGLHLVHRLDRDTSGVVLLATPAADRRALDAAFKGREVEKRYMAVVTGAADALDDEGELRDRLARDPARRDRMVVVPKGGDGALTRYRVVHRGRTRSVVELWPVTGAPISCACNCQCAEHRSSGTVSTATRRARHGSCCTRAPSAWSCQNPSAASTWRRRCPMGSVSRGSRRRRR